MSGIFVNSENPNDNEIAAEAEATAELGENRQNGAADQSRTERGSTRFQRLGSIIGTCLGYCELEVATFLIGFADECSKKYDGDFLFNRLCENEFDDSNCLKHEHAYQITLKGSLISTSVSSYRVGLLFSKFLVDFIFCLALCPWSDLYGRKVPLVMAQLGIQLGMLHFFNTDKDSHSFFYTMYTLAMLSGILGGQVATLAMVYSYAADHSSADNRMLRYATSQATMQLGTAAGSYVILLLRGNQDITNSFLVTLISRFIIVFWVMMTFKDTNFEGRKHALSEKLLAVLGRHINTNFRTISKWRKTCGAAVLKLALLSVLIIYLNYSYIENVIVFRRSSYESILPIDMNFENTSLIFMVLSAFTLLIVACLVRFMVKINEVFLGIVGCISLYLYSYFVYPATNFETFLVAHVMGLLKHLNIIIFCTIISNLSEGRETGSIFMFVAAGQMFGGLSGNYLEMISRGYSPDTEKFPDLPYSLVWTSLMLPFCTFVFKYMSIYVEPLF